MQDFLHFFEMLPIRLIQESRNPRQRFDNRLIVGNLTVEDS